MKPVGKPDALIGHVRFDERGWETGRRSSVSARAHPRLYNGYNTSVYKAMEENHEEITVQAFLAKDGSKHAWAAGLTRADGKTVITLGGLPPQPYNAKPNGDRKVNH